MTLGVSEETRARIRSVSGNASSLLNLGKRIKRKKKSGQDPAKRVERSSLYAIGSNGDLSVQSSSFSDGKVFLVQESDLEDEDDNGSLSKTNNSSPVGVGSSIKSVKIHSSRHSGEAKRPKTRSLRISPSLTRLPRTTTSNHELSSDGFNQNTVTSDEQTDPLGSRLRNNESKTSSEPPANGSFLKTETTTPVKTKSEASDSGIFSSLLNAAHNAANHLIPKTSMKSSGSDIHENGGTTRNTDSGNDLSPADDDASVDPFGSSDSFLNHLDFLLSGTQNNGILLKKTNTLDTLNSAESQVSSCSQPLITPSAGATNEAADDDTIKTENDEISSVGNYIDKVHFQSLKQNKNSPITTFGNGDLTLDDFDKDKPVDSNGNTVAVDGPQIPDLRITKPSAFRSASSSSQALVPTPQFPLNKANSDSSLVGTTKSRNSRTKPQDVLRDLAALSLSHNAASKLITTPLRNSFSGRVRTRGNSASKEAENGEGTTRSNGNSTSDDSPRNNVKDPALQGVEFASAKRNAEFHSIFKKTAVTPTERLVADYSCALSKDILIQGRLYISNKHICFFSNILGWVKTVVVPFKEIVQIEQKNTALLFPNAIAIQTLHDKFLFASFISRDSTFDTIMDVWNQTIINKQVKSKRETLGSADFINDDTGMSNSDISSMEYKDNDLMDDINPVSDSDSYENEVEDASNEDDYDDDINPDEMTSDSDQSSFAVSAGAKSKHATTTTENKEGLGPSSHSPTSPEYTPKDNERDMGEATFDAPLGTVITVLYGSNTKPFEKILKAQGNYDISGLTEIVESKKREYVYTKPISGSIGPSKTKCEIIETVDSFDLDSYVQVTQSSKTPDIPSGSSFVVKTTFLFSWAEDNRTKMKVYTYVDWSAKSWIKAAVEKGTFDGIKSSTEVFIKELDNILEDQKESKKTQESSKDKAEPSSLPTLGPKEHPPTSPTFDKSSDYEVIDDSINLKAPVGTVYQLLCGDDTSYLKRILERQKNFEISDLPPFKDKTRKYSYIKPLPKSIGPKQTKCLIQENIESDNVESCVVLEQVSKTPDIPSGNSFAVHTKFYLSWGEKNTTNMLVATYIEWTGKSWIKSAIQKGSINGQKTGVQDMVAELRDIIASGSTPKKRGATISRRKSERTRSKRKSISKPSNAEEKREGYGILAASLQISEVLKDIILGLPPVILVPCIAVLLIGALFIPGLLSNIFGRSHRSMELVDKNTVLMNGQLYYIIPSIGRYHSGPDNFESYVNRDGDLYVNSEYEVWQWIESRTGLISEIEGNKAADPLKRHFNKSTGECDEREKQNIREIIRLTELQLDKLKSKVNATYESSA